MRKIVVGNTPYSVWKAWNGLLNELRELKGKPTRSPSENPHSKKKAGSK